MGGGHVGWPREGPRQRRFSAELRARERDGRRGPLLERTRLRELMEHPVGDGRVGHRMTHKLGWPTCRWGCGGWCREATGGGARRGLSHDDRCDAADEILADGAGGSPKRKESPQVETEGSAVAIGIDAAVVADHHVMVRQRETRGPGTVLEEFHVAPTLVGMERLSKKLSAYPGALAVAAPPSRKGPRLAWARGQGGCTSPLGGTRHAGRLRGAL